MTGKAITHVASGTAPDVEKAVNAATNAFYTTWGTKVTGTERGSLLSKLADLIEKHCDEIAALEALDCGKSWSIGVVKRC